MAYAHSPRAPPRHKAGEHHARPLWRTLVVDWGRPRPSDNPRPMAFPRKGRSGRPRAETSPKPWPALRGPPAYMTPEHFRPAGHARSATDVYSLGAALYTLLTEPPPIGGNDAAEILRRASAGNSFLPVAPIRSRRLHWKRSASKRWPLIPASDTPIASLAADGAHWLADEPVSAWREPFAARCRRWIRRHQSLVGSATAATLVLLLCLAIGLGIVPTPTARRRKPAKKPLPRKKRPRKGNTTSPRRRQSG